MLRVVWVQVGVDQLGRLCLLLAWTACVPKATRVESYAALPGTSRRMGGQIMLGHAQNRQPAARFRV